VWRRNQASRAGVRIWATARNLPSRPRNDLSLETPPERRWRGRLSARVESSRCQNPPSSTPATSDSERISFNQINGNTGHRIKYAKVDADTGEEVANEDIVKGYALDKDTSAFGRRAHPPSACTALGISLHERVLPRPRKLLLRPSRR
jgi:hypothetical protein